MLVDQMLGLVAAMFWQTRRILLSFSSSRTLHKDTPTTLVRSGGMKRIGGRRLELVSRISLVSSFLP